MNLLNRSFAAFITLALAIFFAAGFNTDANAQSLDIVPGSYKAKNDSRPISVLQNRFFLKSLRPEVGFMTGTILNESYTSTIAKGLRLGMFMGEWAGIEMQWLTTSVSDSADRKALNNLKYHPLEGDATSSSTIVSPDPDVNAIHGMRDLAAVAAPFYGKLNLFDKMIVYTDVYLTAGLSKVETDQGQKNAVLIGAGQRLYLYDSFSVRIDFRNRTFDETRAEAKHRRNSWAVDVGASYLFL